MQPWLPMAKPDHPSGMPLVSCCDLDKQSRDIERDGSDARGPLSVLRGEYGRMRMPMTMTGRTSGGRVLTSGGRVLTSGGRVLTSGGRVLTSGGRVGRSGDRVGFFSVQTEPTPTFLSSYGHWPPRKSSLGVDSQEPQPDKAAVITRCTSTHRRLRQPCLTGLSSFLSTRVPSSLSHRTASAQACTKDMTVSPFWRGLLPKSGTENTLIFRQNHLGQAALPYDSRSQTGPAGTSPPGTSLRGKAPSRNKPCF